MRLTALAILAATVFYTGCCTASAYANDGNTSAPAIVKINAGNFEAEVVESLKNNTAKAVMVEAYLGKENAAQLQIVEQVAQEYAGKVKFVRLALDKIDRNNPGAPAAASADFDWIVLLAHTGLSPVHMIVRLEPPDDLEPKDDTISEDNDEGSPDDVESKGNEASTTSVVSDTANPGQQRQIKISIAHIVSGPAAKEQLRQIVEQGLNAEPLPSKNPL